MYEVPAGGRRYRALELLVKKKRLARTAPVPCIVRTDGLPEEDSLAENVQRAPLHPLDQFRAFLALREKGKSEEEIAAAFFVSVNVVRQRLRLAAVSEKLLEVYAEDGMTLEQLIAFTVNPDPARQEQVWEALQRSHSREAYQIRRMLTEPEDRVARPARDRLGTAASLQACRQKPRDLLLAEDVRLESASLPRQQIRRWNLGARVGHDAIARKAANGAQPPGKVVRIGRFRSLRPGQSQLRRDAGRTAPLHELCKIQQLALVLPQLEAKGSAQLQIVGDALPQIAHGIAPGHGRATSRKASRSTFAYRRVASGLRCRSTWPISVSGAPWRIMSTARA